jgi:hypothetical protein
VSDLIAIGYSLDEKTKNILDGGYTTGSSFTLENGNKIYVGIENTTGTERKISECVVYSLWVREGDSEGQAIYISNGITFGCTREDIIAIYRNDFIIDETSSSLQYTHNNHGYIEFTFKNDKLIGILLDKREIIIVPADRFTVYGRDGFDLRSGPDTARQQQHKEHSQSHSSFNHLIFLFPDNKKLLPACLSRSDTAPCNFMPRQKYSTHKSIPFNVAFFPHSRSGCFHISRGIFNIIIIQDLVFVKGNNMEGCEINLL